MYGRAGFQLLRKMVLAKSAQFTKSDEKPIWSVQLFSIIYYILFSINYYILFSII
ncbi:hypothetical protein AAKU52_002697 [Pedobacter sp. CG_S7]